MQNEAINYINSHNLVGIKAEIPNDLDALNEKISQAYLDKYDSGDNSYYAKGITKQSHVEKTMEFIIQEP